MSSKLTKRFVAELENKDSLILRNTTRPKHGTGENIQCIEIQTNQSENEEKSRSPQ